ncbi:DUF981 family protein [Actinoplanes sp. NPDC000266]
MIMYNALIGVCAGLALLLVPRYWALVRGIRMPLQLTRSANPSAWAVTFGALGAVLTALAFTATITHPLAAAKPYLDTLFAEPSLLLGVLLLAATWRLRRQRGVLGQPQIAALAGPTGWIIFALGVVLVWCCLAILRFDVISAAPPTEPLTGLLHHHPVIENTFFVAVLYGPAALGCLLVPAALNLRRRITWAILYWSWTIAGIGFTLFSALNYYTHTGMLINDVSGTGYRW